MGDVAVWGDFEVHFDQVLGRGGMGTVYKARQISLDRWVAVKVLETSRAPDPSLAQGFLEKFHQEARALAKIQDPRIVTILQAGESDNRCWFAMELIEGQTVEERLSSDGALPEREAARVAAEVARALDAALREGIIHRDVKPANIFLCRDGSVKLGDFGLARSAEFTRTRLTDANAVACTPAYASPEQAEARRCDHRSDIYSLGCVLYEMVTERPPFQGDSNMEILFKQSSEPPLYPRLLNPKLSLALEALILRCLQKDPNDRYPGYGDLIRDLQPAAPVAPSPEWLWPAAAAAGAALFGLILAAVYTTEAPSPPSPPVVRAPLEVPRKPPPPVAPPPEAKPIVAPPPPKPEPKEPDLLEWLRTYKPSGEELSQLDTFYESGAWPTLPFPARFAVEEKADHEDWPLDEALRRLEGDPAIGLLLPGIVRRESRALVAALEHGKTGPDPALDPWLETLCSKALADLRRERAAFEAGEEELFAKYAGTWAWKRRLREIHREFRADARKEVPLDGWEFTRVPRPQEDSSWKGGILQDPTASSTLQRTLAHRGWQVDFSFRSGKGAEDPAFFVIPWPVPKSLTYALVRFRGRECALLRRSGKKVETLAKVEVPEADHHALAFIPRGERTIIYCDGEVLSVEKGELDRVIRLSVQRGEARIRRVEFRP